MDYSAMLSQLNRVPGGMSPISMGRPTGMRPDRIFQKRGGTAATGGQTSSDGYAKRHNRK